MRIDETDDEAETTVVTDKETSSPSTVLTIEQSDAVDMLHGRINSALVGHDADSRLTILETVRSILNQMIDDTISELVDDDEAESDDESDDKSDDNRSDEYEPVSLCPACGEPIDYCLGHGELGDPAGFAILTAHDNGDHSQCVQQADCLGLAD